jgi:hypothetical protein
MRQALPTVGVVIAALMAFGVRGGPLLGVTAVAAQPAPAQPTPAPSPPAENGPRLASIVLAKGIKQGSGLANLLGPGEVTPVDPSTSFVNTDLPYAVIKATSMKAGTEVTIRVNDPTGPAIELTNVKAPRGARGAFDVVLPLYILGTDLESRTGRWSLQVSFDGQAQTPQAAFEWGPASAAQLQAIRDQLAAAQTNPDLHWRLGAALALLGSPAEALPELQTAIRIDPRYALYDITLGLVYERMGRTADAAAAFRTALQQHGSVYDAVYARWAQAHLNRLTHP